MMNDDDLHDANRGALVRLAQALDVPVANFLTDHPVETPGTETALAGLEHPAEVVALLRLFVRLKSPEARARCLAYVVQEVTHDG